MSLPHGAPKLVGRKNGSQRNHSPDGVGDQDAVANHQVFPGHERRAVDLNALVADEPPSRNRHIDVSLGPVPDLPSRCRRAMAQSRLGTRGFDSGDETTMERDVRMADRIDALVQAMKPPVALAPLNSPVVETARPKLSHIENALKRSRNTSHLHIDPRAEFSLPYGSFAALGGGGAATARHALEV